MKHMAILTGLRLVMACISMFFLTQCAGGKSKSQWDDIDYSRVRNRDTYDNDRGYKLPNVKSCTDDDLYNCN